MWKVTRKGLAAHKLRFILTAIAVIIGVAFMSGTFVLTATIQRTFDDLFASIYKGTDAVVRAHAVLKSDFGTDLRPRVPATLLQDVEATPGVEAAHGSVQISYAQIVDKNGKAVGNPGQGPPTLGVAWDPVTRLNPFRLTAGSRAPQGDDEIVVDRHSANKAKLQLSDRITVLSTKAPKVYTLVGIARFGTADSLAGASVVAFTEREAQRLADAPGQYDEISVAAAPGVSQSQVVNNLQQHLPKEYEAVTGAKIIKENQTAIANQLGFINTALLVFAIVALIVGAFVIYNTFSIVVAQRLREMALLRSIGASERQVLTSVLGESVVVGLLASAIGVVAGIGLAIGLRAVFSAVGFDLPTTSIVVQPPAVIIPIVVGATITVLSAVVPARRAARIPPIAALRDVAVERPMNVLRRGLIGGAITVVGIGLLLAGLGGSGILYVGLGAFVMLVGVYVLSTLFARVLALTIGVPLRRVRGITGELARENAARNPRRSALTAAAIMIAVSLVGFITLFASSANASISHAIDQQFQTDYIIRAGSGFGYIGLDPQLAQNIGRLPEVQTQTPIRFTPVKIGASTTAVIGTDPQAAAQMFDFGNAGGSFSAMGPNSIAVSQKKANDKHWQLGDVIPVTFVKTGTVPLRIDYIFTQRGVVGDFLTTLAVFEHNVSPQLDQQIFVKLKPGVTPAQGRAAISPLLKPYPVAKLQDNAQYKADQKAQVNRVLTIVYVLLLLAVIVSLIGIANTLTLSVYERTREVGLLRAVGMSRRQVRSSVRWEAVIITLLGTLLGLALAYFFSWAVIRALRDQGFTRFSAAPMNIVIIVVLFSVLAVVTAILPARRAAKLDVLRAIATE